MKDLLYELHSLLKRNPDGSFSTQANRRAMLLQMGQSLLDAGFKQLHAPELKGRHVNALLQQWEKDGISPATQKNRMSVLRWWAEKIGKAAMLKPRNADYGIPDRQPRATVSKAVVVTQDALARVHHPYIRMSLELQRAFGLRREEAMKLKPHQADHGEKLVLQGSWCKGGRPREVPIRTFTQREVLNRAKALVHFKNASLIPKERSYAEHLHCYEGACKRAGLHRMHGLRHAYAQERFAELAGFQAPVANGPSWGALTAAQKEADYDARLIVSDELGHARPEITYAYLGK
jgi:hypothetical protein